MAGLIVGTLKILPQLVMALSLPFIGAAGAYWWDHRAAGEPAWMHVDVLFFHWRPPDSLAAQLAKLQADEKAAALRVAIVEARQAAISLAAARREDQAQLQIRTVTHTITKEIPLYVTAATDRDLPLSWGFVRLHDAFARGVDVSEIAHPAGQLDGGPASVKPSDAAAIIGANYGACRADSEQLGGLQAWVRDQLAAAR